MVGRVVKVFPVDIGSVTVKGRAPIAIARVALLEPEELELLLDALEKAHGWMRVVGSK